MWMTINHKIMTLNSKFYERYPKLIFLNSKSEEKARQVEFERKKYTTSAKNSSRSRR